MSYELDFNYLNGDEYWAKFDQLLGDGEAESFWEPSCEKQLTPEVQEWCVDNGLKLPKTWWITAGRYVPEDYNYESEEKLSYLKLIFETEQDRLLFKLRWL